MKSILLISPFNKKYKTGNATASEFIFETLKKNNFKVKKIDSSFGLNGSNIGRLNLQKAIYFFFIVLVVLKNLPKHNLIYVVCAMTKFGFIRDFFIFLLSKAFKKKIYFHLHGSQINKNLYDSSNFFMKKLIKVVYNNLDKIIVINKKFINEFNFVYNKNKFTVLPNTIPTNLIEPKFHIKKNSDNLKILFISNYIKSKGYFELLQACKILDQKKINFECKLFGNFIDFQSMSNLNRDIISNFIFDNKLENKIKFHEFLSNSNKSRILEESNIFILPTKYHGEGLPISLIEALAYSNTLISCNHAAISEIIQNNFNGYLLDTNNPKEIADAIEKIYKNKKNIDYFSENSFNLYKEKFSKEIIEKKILSIFF